MHPTAIATDRMIALGVYLIEGIVALLGPPLSWLLSPRHGLTELGLRTRYVPPEKR